MCTCTCICICKNSCLCTCICIGICIWNMYVPSKASRPNIGTLLAMNFAKSTNHLATSSAKNTERCFTEFICKDYGQDSVYHCTSIPPSPDSMQHFSSRWQQAWIQTEMLTRATMIDAHPCFAENNSPASCFEVQIQIWVGHAMICWFVDSVAILVWVVYTGVACLEQSPPRPRSLTCMQHARTLGEWALSRFLLVIARRSPFSCKSWGGRLSVFLQTEMLKE